ncbi:MAG: energy-coupling factor transporter transmembrane protein EcfT [Chloroflexi bacterium HGW-Chloroflexi-10]|nr:MAG: energy-coupling factor transporter transmembrane protein EcfT [Chloroflexi bacterium HGW-Chloroflexi-10]
MSMKFQTVERDSIFTRLDFRPKIYMMLVLTVIALIWESPVVQLAMAFLILIACFFSGVKMKFIRTILLIMIPFYLLLLITHGFFNISQVQSLTGKSELTTLFSIPQNWWLIGGLNFSLEGFWYGINTIFKTLTIVLVVPLVIFTTDLDNIIVGMVRAKVPYKLAFIFSATLRFFPLLFSEIGNIIQAQRLRGLAMEKMNIIQRVSVYAKVAVPLILGAMVQSQQLEIVLQSKAFSGDPDRTYLHESILSPLDYAVLIFFTIFLIAAFVAWAVWGFGAFSGPTDHFLF